MVRQRPGSELELLFRSARVVAVENLNPAAEPDSQRDQRLEQLRLHAQHTQNRWEVTGKVTYAFNDNNKLWGSYTYAEGDRSASAFRSGGRRTWTIPYPSEPVGKETAHVYLANYTHVFSATTTNEFVFSYAEFINNNSLTNTAASSRKASLDSRFKACLELRRPIRFRIRGWLEFRSDRNQRVRLQQRHLWPEHLRQDFEGASDQRYVHEDHLEPTR